MYWKLDLIKQFMINHWNIGLWANDEKKIIQRLIKLNN